MKNRLISLPGMLVPRSDLQEQLSESPRDVYACSRCGAEYINPAAPFKCGFCNKILSKVFE